MSASSRLLQLSWRDRGLLAEAAVWLALSRLAVVGLPFRVLARWLGTHMAESPATGMAPGLSRIGWSIRAVASRVPWRAKCLEQALAAKAMLRRRHIPNTLYLGVGRAPAAATAARQMIAHAWVRSGAVHVTGGAEVAGYGVVSTFADLGAP